MKEHHKKILDKIVKRWKKMTNKPIDKKSLLAIIEMADTDGDGKKRVIVNGETYLVPIEDIILDGIKAKEIGKYPKVKSC